MDSVMLVGTVTILVLTYREIKKRLKSEELYCLAIAMGLSLIFSIASPNRMLKKPLFSR